MANLTPQDLTYLFLAIAVLLGVARLLGELARMLGQPSVLGEIAAGILLGPTILGRLAPDLQQTLFPAEGNVAIVLEALVALSVVLFLLVAGLEVDLSVAFRQGATTFKVAATGMALPAVLGFLTAWFAPGLLMEVPEGKQFVFALFFATALSISALPVVVKILRDVGLIQTDIGVVVVASAIVNDLLGWIVFAIILGMLGASKAALPLPMVILLTLVFVAVMLTIGRWLVHRILVYLQAHLSWPAGVLSLSLSVALFCAAFTEWLGIHAIFGAFLFGVALGDSGHLKQQTRATLDQFISYTFAPIFFASIGLSVDFISNFALVPVAIVFALACVGKIAGCFLGGLWSGLSRRESLAIGAAKNARGAMEIILGLLALRYGLINEEFFVALVIMALLTSMVSGTMVQAVIKSTRRVSIRDLVGKAGIEMELAGGTRDEVINELVHLAVRKDPTLDAAAVQEAVAARERIMPTGLQYGIAIPHARIPGLRKPVLVLGRHRRGVDFDAFDGAPARLVFLLLTKDGKSEDQLAVLRAISQVLSDAVTVERLLGTGSATELLAALKVAEEQLEHAH
ncbi:cation:proton antiporter [bacterium]|nr:cation:proton antiporter [bacterium]